MSRKYSVLFVALAFVVAMAAGAWAWSIPTFSGADATNVANGTNIDVVGVSLDKDGKECKTWMATKVFWSSDITNNGVGSRLLVAVVSNDSGDSTNFLSDDLVVIAMRGYTGVNAFTGLGDPTPSRDIYAAASRDAGPDGALFYLGRGVRQLPFTFATSVDSKDTPPEVGGLSFRLTQGGVFNSSMTTTFGVFNGSTAGAPFAQWSDDIFELGGTVCAGGKCETFFRDVMQVWSGDLTATPSTAWRLVSNDLNFFYYMPCGDFVKDWQVYDYYGYQPTHAAVGPALRYPSVNQTVFPQDMVRYGDVEGTQSLKLGYYVVNVTNNEAGIPDVIVERVLNQTGASVSADLRLPADGTRYFNWKALGQSQYNENGYRDIRADVRDANQGSDTAYLRYQEWDDNRTDAFGYTWYTWYGTTDGTTAYDDVDLVDFPQGEPLDLAPGFARYYVYSADETSAIEMCFKNDGEAICQETTIVPQIWTADGNWCISHDVNSADCFMVWTESADAAVLADVAGWTGITTPGMTVDTDACGTCAGQMHLRTDVNTALAPFNTLGGTVCLGASLDVSIQGAVCGYDLKDVHFARVLIELAPDRVCDATAKANITAAVNKLADPVNKPLNVCPADAFLNPVSVDSTLTYGLDVVAIAGDGTSKNLVDLAKANDFVAAAELNQGIKNYFSVRATQQESVWEAWNDSRAEGYEVLLSFYVAIVNGDAPAGQDAIQAKKGYFLIYAGDANESLTNQVPGYLTYFALMTGYTENPVTPTPTPAPVLTVTADPAITTSAVVECATDFDKALFTEAAWTEILSTLGIAAADEANYTFSYTGSACEEDTVAGLTAGQDVTFTLSYDDGLAAAATTAKVPFVYNTSEAKYDVIAAASETSIATAQTKVWTIAEGSVYDQEVNVAGELKVGFHLVAVTATPVTTPTTAPSSGGGSGCSFGFAPLALLLLAPLALLRK